MRLWKQILTSDTWAVMPRMQKSRLTRIGAMTSSYDNRRVISRGEYIRLMQRDHVMSVYESGVASQERQDGVRSNWQELYKGRMIVVSWRLPVAMDEKTIIGQEGITLESKYSPGGVANGLKPLIRSERPGIWIGWAGTKKAARQQIEIALEPHQTETMRLIGVEFDEQEFNDFYSKFINTRFWALIHTSDSTPEFMDAFRRHEGDDPYYWTTFKLIQRRYAQLLKEQNPVSDDVIWFHDPQVGGVGKIARTEFGIEALMAHFSHEPWPEYRVWKEMPKDIRKDMVESMTYYDLLGFQTKEDMEHFASYFERDFAKEIKEGRVEVIRNGQGIFVRMDGRLTKLNHFLISIDPVELEELKQREIVRKKAAEIREVFPGEILICDGGRGGEMIKMRERGLEDFRSVLADHPELWGETRYILFGGASRTNIDFYKENSELEQKIVKDINEEYSEKYKKKYRDQDMEPPKDWKPIEYLNYNLTMEEVASIFDACQIKRFVTVDGANLMLVEAAITGNLDQVIIGGDKAGVAREMLSDSVVVVDIADKEERVEALYYAIGGYFNREVEGKPVYGMPKHERIWRTEKMREAIYAHPVDEWFNDNISDLVITKKRMTTIYIASKNGEIKGTYIFLPIEESGEERHNGDHYVSLADAMEEKSAEYDTPNIQEYFISVEQ